MHEALVLGQLPDVGNSRLPLGARYMDAVLVARPPHWS
jgi:hypothetical protein